MQPAEPRCRAARARHEGAVRGDRAVGVEYAKGKRLARRARRRGDPLRRRDQLAAAPPALGYRRRRRTSARSASSRHTSSRVSARTCRTTSRCTSSTLHAAGLDAAGAEEVPQTGDRLSLAVPAQRAGRDQPLRGGRLLPLERRRSTYPNLMFHFLPLAIRYDGSQPEGDHGYQVHIGPMNSNARGSVKITSRDPTRQARASASTTSRPIRIGASGSRRSASPATILEPARVRGRIDGGEISPGPAVETDERDPRLGRARTPRRRCIRRARAGWDATRLAVRRPGDDGRPRPRRAARRRRLGVSVRSRTRTSTRR